MFTLNVIRNRGTRSRPCVGLVSVKMTERDVYNAHSTLMAIYNSDPMILNAWIESPDRCHFVGAGSRWSSVTDFVIG